MNRSNAKTSQIRIIIFAMQFCAKHYNFLSSIVPLVPFHSSCLYVWVYRVDWRLHEINISIVKPKSFRFVMNFAWQLSIISSTFFTLNLYMLSNKKNTDKYFGFLSLMVKTINGAYEKFHTFYIRSRVFYYVFP